MNRLPLYTALLIAFLHGFNASVVQASEDTASRGGFFQQLGSALSGSAAEEADREKAIPEKASSERSGFFSQLFQGIGGSSSQKKKSLILEVRTTAYTHSEAGHHKWGRRNAIGSNLQATPEYTSAASDWSRFPLGTKFRFEGEDTVYVIDDYGSALVGTNTIDVYKPTRTQMRNWGVRHKKIEILEIGCFHSSHSILKGRTHNRHCRRMFDSLARLDLKSHPLGEAVVSQ